MPTATAIERRESRYPPKARMKNRISSAEAT